MKKILMVFLVISSVVMALDDGLKAIPQKTLYNNYDQYSVNAEQGIEILMHMGEKSINVAGNQNQFVRRTELFQEFASSRVENKEVGIVAISGNQYIQLGEVATINLILNKPLGLNWAVKVLGTIDNLKNTRYEDLNLIVPYRPAETMDGVVSFDVNLADIFNWPTGMNYQQITFNLFVDSGAKKITEYQVIPEDRKWEEVHQDKNRGIAMKYRLKAPEFSLNIKGIQISTNIMGTKTDLIATMSVYRVKDKQLLGIINNIKANSTLDIQFSVSDTINNINSEYVLVYSLKENIALNTTFNMGIKLIESQKITGNHRTFIVTSNLESVGITVVSKNKPIIMDNLIAVAPNGYALLGTGFLKGALVYELAEGKATTLQYKIYNEKTSKNLTTISNPTINTILGIFVSENLINTSYYSISNLSVFQSTTCNIICQLSGEGESRVVSSNEFKVTLNPPSGKPTPAKVSIKSSVEARGLSETDTSTMNVISIKIPRPSGIDECGIKGYIVYTATPPFDTLRYTEYCSGDFTVEYDNEEEVRLTLNNNYYKIAYRLINWAELVGTYSPGIDQNLLFQREMVVNLYNNPNPFNSSKQDTTIYYTLANNADVDITIYDMFGYVVKKWKFYSGSNGGQITNSIVWNGTNELGKKVSKGGYILILKTTDSAGTKVEKKYLIGIIR